MEGRDGVKVKICGAAMSAYAGQVSECVAMKSGRGPAWTIGPRFAKYFAVIFDHGHCAGRTLWFSRKEVELQRRETGETWVRS